MDLSSSASFRESVASMTSSATFSHIHEEQKFGTENQEPEVKEYVPSLMRKKKNPDGELKVHLPNMTVINVPFRMIDEVEEFKQRITENCGIDMNLYYLIHQTGHMDDGNFLNDYHIRNGDDLITIRKGIRNQQTLKNRKYWLKSREDRLERKQSLPIVIEPKFKPKHNSSLEYRKKHHILS